MAFKLGKVSRDEVRQREEAGDKRLGYSAIVLAVSCIFQGFGIVHFPLGLVCSSVGGLVAGALVCPNPIVAGIGGGAATGAICSLALHCYSKIRNSPSVPELVLLTVLPAIPGMLIGMLLKGLRRRRRWRSEVAIMRMYFPTASDTDLKFPDQLKPNWKVAFCMLRMTPVFAWFCVTAPIRWLFSTMFSRLGDLL